MVSGSLRTCVRQCKRQAENLMKIRSHAPGSGRDRQDRNHNEGNLTSNVATGHWLSAAGGVSACAPAAPMQVHGPDLHAGQVQVRWGTDQPTLRCAFVDRSPAIRSERRSFPRGPEDPGLRSPAHPICRYRPKQLVSEYRNGTDPARNPSWAQLLCNELPELLVPECYHRIDAYCAACGNITGQQCDQRQQNRS